VRPPAGLSDEKVDELVASKRLWIYRNLAEWRDLNATAVVREWVNGETFLYLGRSYRLSLQADQDCDLKLKEGRFSLNRSLIDEHGVSAAKKAFEDYYTQKALRRIKERVAYFAPKVGVKPKSVSIRDLTYRWASCSSDGKLSFHWKCMMAVPKVIDYVVVHELCHMHVRDHSEAFWNEVDKILPDYMERKNWLRQHGAALDI
jgi:predicted metal-dependent hydrolase